MLFCYIILGCHSRTMLLEKSLLILLVRSIINKQHENHKFWLIFDISYSKILALKSVYVMFHLLMLIYGVFRNLNTIVFHNTISQ